MQVGVGVEGHVEVEDDVDLLDVDAATEELRGHEDAVAELLEALVDFQSVFERHLGVDGLGGDGVFVEDLVELDGVVDVADEDDDLVELQLVDQVHELGDLVALLQRHVVLAETMQGQLALFLDEHLGGVAHELAARLLDLVGESRSEHHHLLAMGRSLEDLLDVAAHVDILEHLIALVENEHLQVVQVQGLVLGQVQDTAWGAHDDVGSVGALQQLLLLLKGLATEDAFSLNVWHELGETREFALDLVGKLTGVREDKSGAGLRVLVQAVKHSQDEDGSLAHTRDGLAEYIDAHDGLGDTFLLHIAGMLKAAIDYRLLKLGSQHHILETRGVYTDVVSRGLSGIGGACCCCVCGLGSHGLQDDVVLVVVGKVGVLLSWLGFYHSMGKFG
mmetsp:Transcript_39396/g.51560  ORF Transcript_39396/g.51560 Transcript_39396/m.51560 type:complete len:390 (+) Transcript_39396:638-1807(+)